jgi:3'-5' exoribonuclease
VIGVEMLTKWISRVDGFPKQVGWHLKHIILSHHGKLEFGSPVPPRTLEALIVHFADDLDSKMGGVLKVRNQQLDTPGEWTDFIRLMETDFFKAPILDSTPSAEPKPLVQDENSQKSARDTDSEENQSLF